MGKSTIVSVNARQVMSDRGHPGVEATVVTENGARGVAVCTAGVSVGTHEIEFAYDGGEKWRGKGVMRAVNTVKQLIAPAIMGMDATLQLEADNAMLKIGKDILGGNATGAVSAAVLKAGAASLGIPLYYHIGGANAYTLPVPGTKCLGGSGRYGGGSRSGSKPSYAFMAYDFNTFSDASYALWDISDRWVTYANQKLGTSLGFNNFIVNSGYVDCDMRFWDAMAEVICKYGYENKIGIQVDVASDTYLKRILASSKGFSAKIHSRQINCWRS